MCLLLSLCSGARRLRLRIQLPRLNISARMIPPSSYFVHCIGKKIGRNVVINGKFIDWEALCLLCFTGKPSHLPPTTSALRPLCLLFNYPSLLPSCSPTSQMRSTTLGRTLMYFVYSCISSFFIPCSSCERFGRIMLFLLE